MTEEKGQFNIGNSSGYQVYGGVNTGNIINISGNLHVSTSNQSLSEAAAEIQRLLNQLEETNPNVTESEQATYINIAAKPDLKQRTIAALEEAGETAIDKFVLEKHLSVVKTIVKEWLQLGN